MSRIFVCIPSYRDPECQYTIKSLIEEAENPERVTIGVCFQYHFEEDLDSCFNDWPQELFPDQIRIDRVESKLATGPCWARYRAQQLWRGEEYCLSIDSHTRFTKNWDSVLIKLLAECDSPKPILTTYPAGFERGQPIIQEPTAPFTCAKNFGEDGMLRLTGRLIASPTVKPIPSLFWVSGFSFSSSKIISEVPYDPHLQFIFFGEESSMTVRLWTQGWDFFAPSTNIIYHLWSRSYRPLFRENPTIQEIFDKSLTRIKLTLGIPIDDLKPNIIAEAKIDIQPYSIGNVRTLEEYQTFSGVNFSNKTLSPLALNGGQSEDFFQDYILKLLSKFKPN